MYLLAPFRGDHSVADASRTPQLLQFAAAAAAIEACHVTYLFVFIRNETRRRRRRNNRNKSIKRERPAHQVVVISCRQEEPLGLFNLLRRLLFRFVSCIKGVAMGLAAV